MADRVVQLIDEAGDKIFPIPAKIDDGWTDTYSTDEVRVGTWIDGSPVYRRAILGTTNTSTGTWQTITSGANMDKILSLGGYLNASTTEQKSLPCKDDTWFQINRSSHELQMAHKDSSWNSKEFCVIATYTKV